ncbi:MAG: PPC domain-containing protein [Planctomycetes bacterium]|nr:PPC domain-containing protein [Planctomycetota bacterium]
MMPRALLYFCCTLVLFAPTLAQEKKKPSPGPRVVLTIPFGAAPGKSTKLTIRGKNLDSASEVKVTGGSARILSKGKAGVPDKNPDQVGDTQIVIELKLDAKTVAASLVVVTPTGATKPHVLRVETATAEQEPNDGFNAAQMIALPIVVDGTISRARDVDVFHLQGKKGQRVFAEVHASRHGSPLDAVLALYDGKGQLLASNDDFTKEHRDARIEVVLPADGDYYLSLIDAHDTGGPLHVYRLAIK